MNPPSTLRLNLALAAALLAAALLSLGVGSSGVGLGALLRATDGPLAVIFTEIRLPRLVLAALTGGSLGLAGAVLQGYTRNPLADAGLLGVSSGASLGAVAVFYSGLALHAPWLTPLAAWTGAAATTLLILWLSGRRADIQTLVLAGAAVAALASALTSLLLNLSPNAYAGMEIVFWLLGSVKDRSWGDVWMVLPWLALGWPLLLAQGRALQALGLGGEAALSLGIRTDRTRLQVILGVALTVGPVCAVAGSVGFVGLLVPHLLRAHVGHDPGRLLLPSVLGGALLVVLADCAARAIPTTNELHLGVLTALVGAPFFFHLILRLRKSLP